jgi:hypothetical protein
MAYPLLASFALLALVGAGPAGAQPKERAVTFKPGATSAQLRGLIRGGEDITYRLRTVPGQVLQVLFTPSNRSCYFNAFEPGREDAAHIGSTSGNEFSRSPTGDGEYRLQVYLMRNAARRNESCRYRISFEVTGTPGGVSSGISDRELRDQCRALVATMYGVRNPSIRLGAIGTAADGFPINGSVNKGAEGTKRFRCLFSPSRQLRDVMALTSDGE